MTIYCIQRHDSTIKFGTLGNDFGCYMAMVVFFSVLTRLTGGDELQTSLKVLLQT